MANIDWTTMRWNGKLSWSVDLLYYDKENVDVVQPPYAWRDRNSSFFLRTRKWYVWDVFIKQSLYDYKFEEEDEDFLDRERDITDIKIIWENVCDKQNWTIYYYCITKDKNYKTVVARKIEDWCMQQKVYMMDPWVVRWCNCSDDKLFTTTYVKWEALTILIDKETWKEIRAVENWWTQINRKEWWVTRWYFSIDVVKDNPDDFDFVTPQIWDYVVAYSTTNTEESWFCWQVRTIIWKWHNNEIMVNAPWLWFKDDLDENWEVKWNWVSFKIFHEYWEVIWFTSPDWVELIVNPFDENEYFRTLTMCDFHQWGREAGCIISSTADVERVYFLYENGYIHYWWIGMNKFFSTTDDAFFAGKDKTTITTYRDMILAFWRRHIAVWLWDDTWTYARMYNQSVSIWLKNRYAFGEYNWDMLFVSNDNRLLALQFESNAWTHMLSFQDVWAYANPFLKAMLPTDEAYLWVDNNELRIFINSKSDIDRDTGNSKTMILKYNTIFQTRTVDILKYFLITWCYEWIFFGDDVYYRSGNVDRWVKFDKNPEWDEDNYTLEDREYQVNISAFLLENEENGMKNSDWALDLFRLASLEKLIILLWVWRYSDDLTKIKITEWRWWWGREYEINCLENNDWVRLIWYAYNWEQLDPEFAKKKECVIDSLNDGSKQKRVRCEEWHKIQDPMIQTPWCSIYGGEPLYTDVQLWEHNVCINDEIYELAPTMPLTIQLWDQENYNTGIKVELISTNWDIINFWWFMAELHLSTLWQNMWWDWEYQITVDTGC